MEKNEIKEKMEMIRPEMEKIMEKYKKQPVSFTELLAVVFMALKLTGFISWSWLIVAAVFVVPKIYYFVCCMIACYFKCVKILKDKTND